MQQMTSLIALHIDERVKIVADTIPIKFNERKRQLVASVSPFALVLGTRSMVGCLFLNTKRNQSHSPARILWIYFSFDLATGNCQQKVPEVWLRPNRKQAALQPGKIMAILDIPNDFLKLVASLAQSNKSNVNTKWYDGGFFFEGQISNFLPR